VLLFWVVKFQYLFFGGIVLGFAGLALINFQKALEIDPQKRMYRNDKLIAGQRFGKWQKLPDIDYISIFKTKMTQAVKGYTGSRVSDTQSLSFAADT